MAHIDEKLGNRETRQGSSNILDLFDDNGTSTINVKNMVRVARELGETMTEDELRTALEKCSEGNLEFTLDDFYKVITKEINV